jgi:hypothetical protein
MTHTIRRCATAALALGLLSLWTSGCSSVVGQWSLKEVSPNAAQRDVEYRTLTLQKDGSFYAEASEGRQAVAVTIPEGETVVGERKPGAIETVSGTYTYNSKNKTLALTEHDREQNTYDAQLQKGGKELVLLTFWKDKKMKAVYEKVKS